MALVRNYLDIRQAQRARQAVGERRGEIVGNLGIGLPIVHAAGWRCERSSAERDNQVIHGRAREQGCSLHVVVLMVTLLCHSSRNNDIKLSFMHS